MIEIDSAKFVTVHPDKCILKKQIELLIFLKSRLYIRQTFTLENISCFNNIYSVSYYLCMIILSKLAVLDLKGNIGNDVWCARAAAGGR